MPSDTEPSKTKENIQQFKLRFIGKLSKFTENNLQKLTKQFCKDSTNIKVVFRTFKLASLFQQKKRSHMVQSPIQFIRFSVLAATPVM